MSDVAEREDAQPHPVGLCFNLHDKKGGVPYKLVCELTISAVRRFLKENAALARGFLLTA